MEVQSHMRLTKKNGKNNGVSPPWTSVANATDCVYALIERMEKSVAFASDENFDPFS